MVFVTHLSSQDLEGRGERNKSSILEVASGNLVWKKERSSLDGSSALEVKDLLNPSVSSVLGVMNLIALNSSLRIES